MEKGIFKGIFIPKPAAEVAARIREQASKTQALRDRVFYGDIETGEFQSRAVVVGNLVEPNGKPFEMAADTTTPHSALGLRGRNGETFTTELGLEVIVFTR